ncbi:MAG: SUMF1/EgtB/PvdO family nonheme iron enzyme, partial [Phycisphaerae bacterium]|nr:SUMF1/EgtB/PvdO family nonheme iron enzyme [Phycisphaerae bacterium]
MRTGLIAAILSTNALAQPDPSGIDFVTIGAPGNPAYAGPDPNNSVTGRGGVDYEYRLGRTEVTSAQWMEFYNAFWGRAPHLTLPVRWGAGSSGNPNDPFRLTTADSGMWPAGGMTWRTCAMFCNWLHNDKRTDLDAVMTGAYDVSTFGEVEGRFTDQREHSPGARYWIPTLDEWIKGAYYDPNYGGAGIGGWWWANVNGTNNAPNFGPPGQGEGNAGFNL